MLTKIPKASADELTKQITELASELTFPEYAEILKVLYKASSRTSKEKKRGTKNEKQLFR